MDHATGNPVHILHVDDDEAFLDVSKAHLERFSDDLTVETTPDPRDALDRIDGTAFDCVVSDYNMDELTGIELLESVREDHDELPFILFTGRGSEEVASKAISAGVTDYLQKEVGSDQYTVLWNRIRNAVDRHRAIREVADTREFYGTILENSWDFVMIVDPNGIIDYVSPAVERVMGWEPADLVGTNAFEFTHPEDRERAFEALTEVITSPDRETTVVYRGKHADGSWPWIEVRGGNLTDEPSIDGILVNVRDVTERKRYEGNLERQTERLQELTQFISHDVTNQLTIIDGQLSLIADDMESEHLDIAMNAIGRVDEMIEGIRHLAETGFTTIEPIETDLATVAEQSWTGVRTSKATCEYGESFPIMADPDHLQRLLENLFRNAIEHGGDDVMVTVGTLDDDRDGFFVADDGVGLPMEAHDKLFDSGYSQSSDGMGLGLAIVKRIATSHGWTVSVDTSNDGGARFEFDGVTTVDTGE